MDDLDIIEQTHQELAEDAADRDRAAYLQETPPRIQCDVCVMTVPEADAFLLYADDPKSLLPYRPGICSQRCWEEAHAPEAPRR